MSKSGSGVGFCGLLTIVFIVFIVLKLCKTITWSWLWVLSPLWIPVISIIVIFILIVLLAMLFDDGD